MFEDALTGQVQKEEESQSYPPHTHFVGKISFELQQ